MSKVDNSAYKPLNPETRKNSKIILLEKSSGSSLEYYLFAVFILLTVILASIYLKKPDLESPVVLEPEVPELKTTYSGVSTKEGEIYFLNRHEARRRRSASFPKRHEGVRGLAVVCASNCYFKLRRNVSNSSKSELRIHLFRWRQLPSPHNKSLRIPKNKQIRPFVLFLEPNNVMHSRLSKVAPDCIYSAHVNGASESSIVNLCDSHGGLFGTLALPDGTYVIEPIDRSNATAYKLSRTAHLVYKSRSLSFQSSDYSVPNIPANHSGEPDQNAYSNGLYSNIEQSNKYDDNNANKKRSRRSANSWDHYVEVLAVADYSMYQYHHKNLENYILTLFSTAASIYRHPSLNSAINIVLVKITVLKQRMPDFEGEIARDILTSFCSWQKRFNDPSEDSLNHHDVALFITRNNLCRSPGQCDTLGLAELGMMCEPDRSCAIIEDNGLSTGFTITHELGHIFNMPHDQEEPCNQYMSSQPNNFHIMAKTVRYDTHPWSWSPCSSAILGKFLDTKRYRTQCLLDPPSEKRYLDRILEMPSPGSMFTADQQCKLVFGSDAKQCTLEAALKDNETCTRLWCEGYFLNNKGFMTNGCRTHYLPWADGTPCGNSRWCHQGKCVGMAPQQRSKHDGGWGEWEQWGECSRTCGGGVQRAYRQCNNPSPSGGGRYCVGQRERYRLCNIWNCPFDTPGFRETQCSAFDYRDTGIRGVPRNARWVPKYEGVSPNERCKLYCHEDGKSAFYLLKGKVVDGTPCDRDSDDICIDGVCHKAGCDHRLGSDLRRDRCGICGGDNTSCRSVTGSFTKRGHYGYTEVTKVPAGATDFEITQRGYKNQRDDDIYLALRGANNEFILNGNYQVSVYPVQITVQNVVIWYSGSDNVIERINGSGPLRSDIYLMVLSVGKLYPPDIHYRYMLPLDAKTSLQQKKRSNYYWRVGDAWTDCSALCQGQQSQTLICTDAVTGRDVHRDLCPTAKPSLKTRMCNLDCFIKWRPVTVGLCSVTCGHGEIRQRSDCIRHYNDGREEIISDAECRNFKKPSIRRACYVDCAGRKWSYSDWAQCSETCGNRGIMQRHAVCVDQNGRPIDEKFCERVAKEIVERECNRVPCPKWVYAAWSECSRSCDGGVRVRNAICQDATGREIHPRMCNANEKRDREVCNEHLCTKWHFDAWSPCSVTCGDGVQTRGAFCVDRNGRKLDPSRCNPRHRHVQKQCHRSPCPNWRLGGWSSCSATCSDGWRTRRVSCVDQNGKELESEKCLSKGKIRPSSHERCNLGTCPFWTSTSWSQCSVTCGSGRRSRKAECVYRDKIVDSSLCDELAKPKSEEICHLYACAHWVPSAWGPCSVSCGRGHQRRDVHCIRNGGSASKTVVHENECDRGTRPNTEQVCEGVACNKYSYNLINPPQKRSAIRWETGIWSDCSKTCGNGVRKRQVKCIYNGRETRDVYCKSIPKPSFMQYCRVRSCAKWVLGDWKPCPETCGSNAVTERHVMCKTVDTLKTAKESECDLSEKPVFRRSCNLSPCPSKGGFGTPLTYTQYGTWVTGSWGQCSTTCGPGWRRRIVTCNGRSCSESLKPLSVEHCNLRNCTTSASFHAWKTGIWSRCSVTCGGGMQRRDIWCEDSRTRSRIPEKYCYLFQKPAVVQRCAENLCNNVPAPHYNWNSSKWTPGRSTSVQRREQVYTHMKKRRRYKA